MFGPVSFNVTIDTVTVAPSFQGNDQKYHCCLSSHNIFMKIFSLH